MSSRVIEVALLISARQHLEESVVLLKRDFELNEDVLSNVRSPSLYPSSRFAKY